MSAAVATAHGRDAEMMARRSLIATAFTLDRGRPRDGPRDGRHHDRQRRAAATSKGTSASTIDQATFIVTGYIVANVIVVPLTPWLQARFGTRNYFATSIALFTFASVMCGVSSSFGALVFWRIVQGLGGGGLISTSQTILRSLFPPGKQGSAQAFFAAGTLVGPTAGPMLGGWITENASWQWCFFVNLPIGLLAFALCLTLLPNERARAAGPLDAIGVGLLIVGLGSLQYVLDQGERSDWFDDTSIVVLTAVAAIGLIAFVTWVLNRQRPDRRSARAALPRGERRERDRRRARDRAVRKRPHHPAVHAGAAGLHAAGLGADPLDARGRDDLQLADRGHPRQTHRSALADHGWARTARRAPR